MCIRDSPWGVTFTDPIAATNVGTPLGVSLHPTQLYESLAAISILVFLLLFERKGRTFHGRTFLDVPTPLPRSAISHRVPAGGSKRNRF